MACSSHGDLRGELVLANYINKAIGKAISVLGLS